MPSSPTWTASNPESRRGSRSIGTPSWPKQNVRIRGRGKPVSRSASRHSHRREGHLLHQRNAHYHGRNPFKISFPTVDADVVTKLKQAGAIILGKTVTTVFVFLDPVRRETRGISTILPAAPAADPPPQSLPACAREPSEARPSGPSGRPAAYNGVVSLMPTQSRVSLRNVFPLSWPLDHAGIFGRSVADVELQLKAIANNPVESIPLLESVRSASA